MSRLKEAQALMADRIHLRHSTDKQTDARRRHALATLLAPGAPVYEDPATSSSTSAPATVSARASGTPRAASTRAARRRRTAAATWAGADAVAVGAPGHVRVILVRVS
ncbi:hypothetical protein [Kitasatospora sp. NPDC056181]|uniref:hypothetical protein n=1 Tax=Kitasatospora sp. NPDC056181 TaxID=3345737 RepID=UPI0035DA0CC2